MTGNDIDALIADYVAGGREPDMMGALAQALDEDPVAREQFANSMSVDRYLRQSAMPRIQVETVMRALPLEPGTAFQDSVLARIEASPSTVPSENQPQHMPHPVQARRWSGRVWQAAALLAVAIGLGAVFGPRHAVTSPGDFVHLARTDAAQWVGTPLRSGQVLSSAPLRLTSGLAELVTSTGATVIIEGPAEFAVLSAQHIDLHQGRATAHVPPAARGFTISSAGLEAIDRGTDFGMSVAADGRAEVQVFTGRVDTRLTGIVAGENAPAGPSLTLHAGEAATLDPKHEAIRPTPAGGLGFITSMTAPVYLDLSDMVAGGDGSGNGRFNGINPATGEIVDAPALGIVRGDKGDYHRVKGSTVLDGIFIPRSTPGGTQIDSAGHHFSFTATDPTVYDLLRRGGTWDVPTYGGTPEHPGIPPVLSGVDYGAHGHSALGMHANCGLTISLRGLTAAHPHQRAVRFTAHIGNVGFKDEARGMVDCWVFLDGRVVQHLVRLNISSPTTTLDVPITAADQFLTLVSCVPENISLAWLTFGDPRFEMVHSDQP